MNAIDEVPKHVIVQLRVARGLLVAIQFALDAVGLRSRMLNQIVSDVSRLLSIWQGRTIIVPDEPEETETFKQAAREWRADRDRGRR